MRLLLASAALLSSSCASMFVPHRAGDVAEHVAEHELEAFKGESIAGVVTTSASARSVIFRSHSFAAEPPPDTATSVVAQLSASLDVENKASTGVGGAAGFTEAVASSLTRLGKRTQGVTLFRDATFRLAEARANSIERDLAIFAKVERVFLRILTELHYSGWLDRRAYITRGGKSALIDSIKQLYPYQPGNGKAPNPRLIDSDFLRMLKQITHELLVKLGLAKKPDGQDPRAPFSDSVENLVALAEGFKDVDPAIVRQIVGVYEGGATGDLLDEVSERIGRGLDRQWFDAYHATLQASVKLAMHELTVNPTLAEGSNGSAEALLPNRFEGSKQSADDPGQIEVRYYSPIRTSKEVKVQFEIFTSKDLFAEAYRTSTETLTDGSNGVWRGTIEIDLDWIPRGLPQSAVVYGELSIEGARRFRIAIDTSHLDPRDGDDDKEEEEGAEDDTKNSDDEQGDTEVEADGTGGTGDAEVERDGAGGGD